MRVCIVDPKGIHMGFNTGIGYLVAYLRSNFDASEVKVFDFNNNGRDIDERLREISGFDIIGFSMKSFTRESALKMARKVKTDKNILIAGGPHITLDGVNFLKDNPIFDYGVSGEGELTLHKLLLAIKANKENPDLAGIKGLVYRLSADVISTGKSERGQALDTLPYPDYTAFDSLEDGRILNYPLVTSRGCPYLCTYCCVKDVMGKQWFARSVEDIITELIQAKKTYGFESFNIQDDNFSLDVKRAKAFCDAMIERGLDMTWSCPNGIRADKLDDELMAKMHTAGCFAVAMGIESGVEGEFNAIKKGEKLSDIVTAVKLAKKNNIWVFGNFIIGLPHSNLKSIYASVKFAKELELESCIFNLIVPFPGTELWGWANENGQFLMDWKDGFTQGKSPKIVFETDEFSRADRIKAYWKANIKCNNYFACMDEHDSLASNIINVWKKILRYDPWGTPVHLLWCLKHFTRIITRIKSSKNA